MEYTLEDAALSASLLGVLFYVDPDDDRCAGAVSFICADDAAAQWPDAGADAAAALDLARRNAAAQDETLHEAFARLFVGPNRLPAPPWGSVYTDPESVIFGNLTLDVRAWMRANGVKVNLPSRQPEDQFGLMLTLFSWAARNEVSEEALRELIERHLMPWAPRFLELLGARAEGTFYEGLAALAAVTLDTWTEAFDLEPERRRLYR